MAALREGRAGRTEPGPAPSGRWVAGGTAGARARRAGLRRSIAAGPGRAGEAIRALWAGGTRRAGEPIPRGGRREAGMGQAIYGSWRNPSRPLSLRLINTAIELLIVINSL